MRARFLGLLAIVLVAPALAQMEPIINIQSSEPPPIHSTRMAPSSVKKVMTAEEAEARIAKLNQEKRELSAKLDATLATLDQWTKKGGSLVHAYCASDTLSLRSDGAGEEDCAASGYACAPTEGTCRKSCNVTTDCAGYHVCDTAAHVCVKA